MTFKSITKEDLPEIIQIQKELFPQFSARANYEESVSGITDYKYYMVYQDDKCIGITGFYTYPVDPDSAWLGWFGIREPYRRKGYGTKVIRCFENEARENGYKFARLYTDKYNNDIAIAFYTSVGFTGEDYHCPDDEVSKYPVLIFSKALGSDPLVPWNNRNIHLAEQMEKELLN